MYPQYRPPGGGPGRGGGRGMPAYAQYRPPGAAPIPPHGHGMAPGRGRGMPGPPEPPSPLTEEVELFESPQERERLDNLAQLYSIIVTTQRLEQLYVKGIDTDAYSALCTQLIAKYKNLQNLLHIDFDQFCTQYGISAVGAKHRFEIGVDATVEFRTNAVDNQKKIAETVQFFITMMDNLRLELRSIDEVYPLLKDLVDGVNSIRSHEFAGREKLVQWLSDLNSRSASDQLSEDEVRQLLFDLENAYNMFMQSLA